MGEASIEHLLQVTAAIPDNGFSGSDRGRSDRPGFAVHLRNMGSPTPAKTRLSASEDRRMADESAVPERGEATRQLDSGNAPPNRVASENDTTTDAQAVSSDEPGSDIDQANTTDDQPSYDAAVLAATSAAVLSTELSELGAELPAGEKNDVIDAVVTPDALPIDETAPQATPQIDEALPSTQQPIETIESFGTAFEIPLDETFTGDKAIPVREDQAKIGERAPRITNANLTLNQDDEVAAAKSPDSEHAQKSVMPIAGLQANPVATRRVDSSQSEAQTSNDTRTQSDGDVSATISGASNTEVSAPENGPRAIPSIADSLTANAQPDVPTAAQSTSAPTEQVEKVTPGEPTRESTEAPAKTDATRADGLLNSLTRLQRAAVTGAERGGQNEMPRVDAARFVSRVAKAFHAAQDRQGPLQLRLSPPELGSLHLELTIKDGALTAALETESPTAKRVLLEHLPALRDRLAEQNIRIERFDVDVRRDGGGQQQSGPHDQRQLQQEMEDARAARASSRQLASAQRRVDEPQIIQTSASPDAGLNLVI